MADNDFGMVPNNPAAGSEVATAPTPAGQGKGESDQGAAQADGKVVTGKDFSKEFDIASNAEDDEKATADPPKKTVVTSKVEDETEDDADEATAADADEQDEDEAEGADAADEAADDDVTSIEDFLKDTDEETRQDLLTALAGDEKLSLDFTRNGETVSAPVADILRSAAGYPGAEAVTARAADLKKAEAQLQTDQDAFTKTLADPSEFLDFVDGHIEDPVKFYTSIRDRAESVLKESEDDPAGFRRKHADRREAITNRQETVALREEVAGLRKVLSGDTPKVSVDEEKAIRQEGQTRRSAVETAGFDVNVVDNHWIAAGSPADFDRWFGAWGAINPGLKGKGTPNSSDKGKKKPTTSGKKKKKGLTLRRAGSVGAGTAPTTEDTGPVDAESIEKFLREHPSNQHLTK